METCSRCGAEFNLANVKRKIGRLYGAGSYGEYFPCVDVCGSCAIMEMSADFGAGEEDRENMGSGWDYD